MSGVTNLNGGGGKTGILVQARLGSSRLPSKVLMPFAGTTLLGFLMERLKNCNLEIVVATTDLKKDQPLVNYLRERKVKYYRGSENNVLERFIAASEEHGFTHIVRVCADNPLIDLQYLTDLLNYSNKFPEADYLSFSFQKKPVITTHFGVFAEVMKVDALRTVSMLFPHNANYKEHVTNGLYLHPNKFNIQLLPMDEPLRKYAGIRLTIDTLEDYNTMLTLLRRYPQIEGQGFEKIAACVKCEPDLMEQMQVSMEQNKK